VETTAEPVARPATRGPASLWLALVAGPAAGALQLSVNYALVKWACATRQTWVLAALAVSLLVISLAGVALAAVHLVSVRPGDRVAELWSADSRRLLAAIAIGLDACFAIVVLNTLIAIAVLSPCE
jgi:hypothetical protein